MQQCWGCKQAILLIPETGMFFPDPGVMLRHVPCLSLQETLDVLLGYQQAE